ncbi:MAG: FxsA family protein [Devosia sp.]|nr:FxsA family protein [Devosia sp.]
MVGRLIFLAFLAIPLIEIALFVLIGQAIGLWPTLLGVVVIALLGSAIIRHQGLALLAEVRGTMGRGQLPARALADAMLVSIAGVLMVTPGYFTDLVGLLLLVPAVRGALYRLLRNRIGFVDITASTSRPADAGTIELDETHFRPR